MAYNGGKNGSGVWQRIINEIPPHETLIVPFGGHCAITRKLRPCTTTYLVEKDAAAVGLWTGKERPNLKLIHGDAFQVLPLFKQIGLLEDHATFVYADPPYPLSARRSSKPLYNCELADAQHRELLLIVTRLKCRVAVSGYHYPLYDEALRDWRLIEFPAMTRGGHVATEVLWMNYPAPVKLHDDRWLDFGKGWRERDRINKKIKRLRGKLAELPAMERRRLCTAVLAELGEIGQPRQ